jgi:anti-sigma28 factor (negative regulator of flagellin synthesis)
MIIKEVYGDQLPLQPTGQRKVKQTASVERTDKVDVSPEARSLFEAGKAKKLDEISQKIDAGFYFKPETTEKVAESILKDLQKPEP